MTEHRYGHLTYNLSHNLWLRCICIRQERSHGLLLLAVHLPNNKILWYKFKLEWTGELIFEAAIQCENSNVGPADLRQYLWRVECSPRRRRCSMENLVEPCKAKLSFQVEHAAWAGNLFHTLLEAIGGIFQPITGLIAFNRNSTTFAYSSS